MQAIQNLNQEVSSFTQTHYVVLPNGSLYNRSAVLNARRVIQGIEDNEQSVRRLVECKKFVVRWGKIDVEWFEFSPDMIFVVYATHHLYKDGSSRSVEIFKTTDPMGRLLYNRLFVGKMFSPESASRRGVRTPPNDPSLSLADLL